MSQQQSNFKQHNQHLLKETASAQQLAADPSCNVFVSASAGSGKTKVLIDRFLRLMLENNTPAEKILCLTYTNTAANEIKQRLLWILKKWHLADEDAIINDINALIPSDDGVRPKVVNASMITRARRLYSLFIKNYSRLKICTIHAFCSKILQINCNINNQISFKVLSQELRQQLIENAVEVTLEDEKHAQALSFLFQYYEKSFVAKILAETFNKISSQEEHVISPPQASEDQEQEYRAMRYKQICQFIEEYEVAIEALLALKNITISEQQLIDIYDKSSDEIDKIYDDVYQAIYTKSGAVRKKVLPKAIADDPNMQSFIDDFIKLQELLLEVDSQHFNWALSSLFQAAYARYDNLKREEHYHDFDDLIDQALKVLASSNGTDWLLYSLDYELDHVMVDEAQDTSPKQWEIVKLITSEFFTGLSARELVRTIFIVGDFKQSIYSFQGANPFDFLQVKKYFARLINNLGRKWREVDFNASFRSTDNILQLVDAVFSQHVYSHAVTGQRDGGAISHNAIKGGSGRNVMHSLVEKIAAPDYYQEGWQMPFAEQPKTNAAILVERISALVLRLTQRSDSELLVAYDEIMILFRSRSSVYNMLIERLRQLHIPLSCNDNRRFNDIPLIQDLLRVVHFILFPYDDYNLLQVLRSPALVSNSGLSGSDLHDTDYKCQQLVLARNENDPNSNIYQYISQDESYHNLYLKLSKLHFLAAEPPQVLLDKILFANNVYDNLLHYYGEGSGDIIEEFLVSARELGVNISNHYEFYDRLCGNKSCYTENIQNGTGIQIMTAHAAKGLQAKIVILGDAAGSDTAVSDSVICDHTGINFIPPKIIRSEKYSSLAELNNLQDYAENLRLLYVALTRAENSIHIFGKEGRNLSNSWYNILLAQAKDLLEYEEHDQDSIENLELVAELAADASQSALSLQSFELIYPFAGTDPLNDNLAQVAARATEMDELAAESTESHKPKFYNNSLALGEMTHLLLQKLPQLKMEDWLSHSLLIANGDEVVAKDIHDIASKTIENYPFYFYERDLQEKFSATGKIYSELPLSTNVNGKCQKLIIDKLLVIPEKKLCIIIDFKTDHRINTDFLSKYKKQLESYYNALQSCYPGYSFQKKLLFLNAQQEVDL